MTETLFLLDAMALIYRAHFAFIKNPRINSKGVNTSAIFGFTNSLFDIVNNERPTHIGIVYDTHVPTFRHIEYPEYKANRQEQPEDIAVAIPYIHRMADALGIPNLWLDGYEADDVIGTLAVKAAAEGMKVYMMTPDKDYGQVVAENIYQYKPGYQGKPAEKWGIRQICEQWDIANPLQVIDILGLMGDSVDNIPGVPSIGPKTAAKLIQDYGSVEGIYENINKIAGKTGKVLAENKDKAILSKRLATIDINVPIAFVEKDLTLDEPHPELFKQILEELEFKSMMAKFFPNQAGITSQTGSAGADLFSTEPAVEGISGVETTEDVKPTLSTIADVAHNYILIESKEDRVKLCTELKKYSVLSFDTETSELSAHNCRMVGFSFSTQPGNGWYISALPNYEAAKEAISDFTEIFENEETLLVAQNIKYDMLVIKKYGICIKCKMYDTMLAHYLIEPDLRHNMDFLSELYLGYKPISITQLIGNKGKKQLSMADLTPQMIVDYAAEDTDVTLQLYGKLEPEIQKVGANHLLYEVEIPLTRVLADMESVGVKIDSDALNEYSKQLKIEIDQLEILIQEAAGLKFNIGSPSQLGQVLFDHLKLDPKAKKTAKSKQYATGEDVLSNLMHKHPVVSMILDYRQTLKLKSTYVDALPLLVNKTSHRIHTTYNQAVAATGRLSSTDPNLQNIPIRTERGREIRKAFIPRDSDHTILSADYSQIELRLIAELSGEQNMLKAFSEGLDIHRATAARIYKVNLDEVDDNMRRMAKTVNFGIIYGMSAFGLSSRLNISRGEAKELIDAYNLQYPAINQYMQDKIQFAREYGYVETLLGRRRYLRDINSGNQTTRGYAERNAINAPIQGTAADMIKKAMVLIHNNMRNAGLKSKMIMQVHDELVFDAVTTELEQLKALVHHDMINALPGLKVPIEVEMGTGRNWLEAH
ncbi:MAG: DNA polymerase I [Bacteroidota bacterium]|nr:DNA polymerase I [Bacteroidota bacterium]